MRGLGLCGGGVGKFFRYEKENPISSSYLFPVRVSGGNKKEKLAQKKEDNVSFIYYQKIEIIIYLPSVRFCG